MPSDRNADLKPKMSARNLILKRKLKIFYLLKIPNSRRPAKFEFQQTREQRNLKGMNSLVREGKVETNRLTSMLLEEKSGCPRSVVDATTTATATAAADEVVTALTRKCISGRDRAALWLEVWKSQREGCKRCKRHHTGVNALRLSRVRRWNERRRCRNCPRWIAECF